MRRTRNDLNQEGLFNFRFTDEDCFGLIRLFFNVKVEHYFYSLFSIEIFSFIIIIKAGLTVLKVYNI